MVQVPWQLVWVQAQRPLWQVLRRAGDGPRAVAGAPVRPSPLQGRLDRAPRCCVDSPPGMAPTSPLNQKVPSSTPIRARTWPARCRAAGPKGKRPSPRPFSRTRGPRSTWGWGQPGQAAYQVLQFTRILLPGAYTSWLCTQGHSSSLTQPPRPSSSSPSGHTQPLTHSVWYWGSQTAGVGDSVPGQPCPAAQLSL